MRSGRGRRRNNIHGHTVHGGNRSVLIGPGEGMTFQRSNPPTAGITVSGIMGGHGKRVERGGRRGRREAVRSGRAGEMEVSGRTLVNGQCDCVMGTKVPRGRKRHCYSTELCYL